MIFYLLGSVIAIFFVGKATKEVEEKQLIEAINDNYKI